MKNLKLLLIILGLGAIMFLFASDLFELINNHEQLKNKDFPILFYSTSDKIKVFIVMVLFTMFMFIGVATKALQEESESKIVDHLKEHVRHKFNPLCMFLYILILIGLFDVVTLTLEYDKTIEVMGLESVTINFMLGICSYLLLRKNLLHIFTITNVAKIINTKQHK